MTGGASDLEFRFDRDECGDRLLLGVESGTVKLAVVAPDEVPRAALKSAAAGCVRELVGHAGPGDAAGDAEQATPGVETASGPERAASDE